MADDKTDPKMKLYHFCSVRQGDSPGVLSFTDGIITSNADLGDPEQYSGLKQLIVEHLIATYGAREVEIALLSLTPLGEATPD